MAARRSPSPKKRQPRADGRKSPSPIKVKITRSSFAKIEAAKAKNKELGTDQPAKLQLVIDPSAPEGKLVGEGEQ